MSQLDAAGDVQPPFLLSNLTERDIPSFTLRSGRVTSTAEGWSFLRLLLRLDHTRARLRNYTTHALKYALMNRYADDICNTPPDPRYTLTAVIADIYHNAIELEDTAHYNASGAVHHITFLDLRWDINERGVIVSSLFSKSALFPFKAVGIENAKSNTSTALFAKVFASEGLRFYAACSHYETFFAHLYAYFVQFLDKGYPRPELTTSLTSIFRRHANGKYGITPAVWVNDLLAFLAVHHPHHRDVVYAPPRRAPPRRAPTRTALRTRARDGPSDSSRMDGPPPPGHTYPPPTSHAYLLHHLQRFHAGATLAQSR